MSTVQNNRSLVAEITTGVAVQNVLPDGGEAGQLLAWTEEGAVWQNLALPEASAEQAGVARVGDGLRMEDGALCVDVAESIAEGDERPVSSAAVYAQLGDVEALLSKI